MVWSNPWPSDGCPFQEGLGWRGVVPTSVPGLGVAPRGGACVSGHIGFGALVCIGIGDPHQGVVVREGAGHPSPKLGWSWF